MKFKSYIFDHASILAIAANTLLIGFDLFHDYSEGQSMDHSMIAELVMMAISVFFLIILLRKQFNLKSEVMTLHLALDKTQAQAAEWKIKNGHTFKGLSKAIDEQLTMWSLTHAEKEVALLLLKGLSHKEIADLRESSEKTVRQQSSTIYHKSGLGGRNHLSAFFLEDLMLPQEKTTIHSRSI